MRKTVALIIMAATFSCSASAGDYSDAVAKQEVCENQGKSAIQLYQSYKSSDDPFDFSLKTLTEHTKILNEAMNTNDDAQRIRLTLKASVLNAGINSNNKKSAYMRAWGECMDTLSNQ